MQLPQQAIPPQYGGGSLSLWWHATSDKHKNELGLTIPCVKNATSNKHGNEFVPTIPLFRHATNVGHGDELRPTNPSSSMYAGGYSLIDSQYNAIVRPKI